MNLVSSFINGKWVRQNANKHLIISVSLLLIVLMSAGCGYRQQDLFRQDVKTIAIPIFENRSFEKGTEFELTEAIIKQVELRTPYKSYQASDNADTQLTGQIVSVTYHQLSRTQTGGLALEVEVAITVDFQWRRLNHSAEILCQRDGLTVVGRAVVAAPANEPIEVAKHRAIDDLARKIVDAMRADW